MTVRGDPRGVDELARTATGYAFVLHGFARLKMGLVGGGARRAAEAAEGLCA